jgi:hypothetical protein
MLCYSELNGTLIPHHTVGEFAFAAACRKEHLHLCGKTAANVMN